MGESSDDASVGPDVGLDAGEGGFPFSLRGDGAVVFFPVGFGVHPVVFTV